MNLIEYFKVYLKSICLQWKAVLLSFVVMPLMMVVLLGFFNGDGLSNRTLKKVNVKIEDQDRSQLSKQFKTIFDKTLFTINGEKTDYKITIPKDYEQKLMKGKQVTLKVEVVKKDGEAQAEMIQTVIDAYNKQISPAISIGLDSTISNKEEILNAIQEFDQASILTTHEIKKENKLTTYEQIALSIIGFIFITSVMTLGEGIYKQGDTGLEQRTHTLPITKIKSLLLDFVSHFIFAFIQGGLFIGGLMLTGIAFSEAAYMSFLIPVLLLQALLVSALSLFITVFISKKAGTIVLYLLMYAELILGGIFSSFDIDIINQLERFSPSVLLRNLYENILQMNHLQGTSHLFVLGGLVTLVLMILSVLKTKLDWGKQ